MTVWALEGVSFVGKTTIANTLASTSLVEMIPEYHDFDTVGATLADLDSPSEAEELVRVDRYCELDEERWASALMWSSATNVLMDRCHISVLAFSGALEDRLNLPVYDATKREIDMRLASGEYRVRNPDVVLFLRVSPREAIRRYRLNAVRLPPFTLDSWFLDALCARYIELVRMYADQLIEIDAERDPSEVLAEVRGRIGV
jgi:thymidylate kinase